MFRQGDDSQHCVDEGESQVSRGEIGLTGPALQGTWEYGRKYYLICVNLRDKCVTK
jgi:hypothetical protein